MISEPLTFYSQSITVNHAWGASPARAEVDYVGDSPIAEGSSVTITLPGHAFYGVCVNNSVSREPGGFTGRLQFVDNREFLQWDIVYCAFNKPDVRMVSGRRVKRWWHVLPWDFNAGRRYYTDAPLSAVTILNYLFAAPTVETSWTRTYHGDLGYPVYDVDCLNGRPLGVVVEEVSSRLGLSFTLQGGPFWLVWSRRGEGLVPAAPPGSTRFGAGLSGYPTRVRILGDRNLYQQLDVPMVADWNPAWEQWYDENLFINHVYEYYANPKTGAAFQQPSDTEQKNRFAAAAYAYTLTLRDVVALENLRGADGNSLVDYRLYAGRCRMEMPVVLYLRTILFRAFRPNIQWFVNAYGAFVPLDSLTIVAQNLAAISHDPLTGLMVANVVDPIEGEGYAVAKGYQLWAEGFRDIRSEYMRLSDWTNLNQVWSRIRFHVDESGVESQFILFDQPVIKSENLVTEVDGHLVVRANPTIEVPEVRAAITFAAERFSYFAGSGGRDAVEYVGGLNAEFLVSGGQLVELPYADGETVTQKAAEFAVPLLNRPFSLTSGGWSRPGSGGQQLGGQIGRVVVRLSPGTGLTEEVDYALEREPSGFVPERDLDRRRSLEQLLPGEQELRRQAGALEKIGRVLRDSPSAARSFNGALLEMMGVRPTKPAAVMSGAGTLEVGTPLWKQPYVKTGTAAQPVMPAATGNTHTVLAGVTVRDGENAGKEVLLQASGEALARVRGPVNVGDSLGRSNGNDYLVAGTDAGLVALQSVATSVTQLIRVRFGGGGGGGQVRKARLSLPYGDYLQCTVGSETIKIAKSSLLRRTPYDGQTYKGFTYNYISDTERTATAGTYVERQTVTPSYEGGDTIYYVEADTGVNEAPKWLDLNVDARAWAQKWEST